MNRHINIAETYANKMRLYDRMQAGECLLADAKLNLRCLFEPDHEVMTYSSPAAAEAVSKAQQLLAQPEQASAIAARGQARTLKHHTYTQRMVELVALLKRHLSKRGSSSTAAPRPQTLLVACRAEHFQRIPAPLTRALRHEHPSHRMRLVSDAAPQTQGLRGIQRWCSPTLGQDATQVQPCLDAMEPDQMLIVDGQPTSPASDDWIAQLTQQAEARKILCTVVRPEP